MRTINHIVIHCTATRPNATEQAILNGWRKKGWIKNGYHQLVNQSGRAVRLMDDSQPSNGVYGHNHDSINICYIGGIDANGKAADTRTPEQKGMLETLVMHYKKLYPNAEVCGHRDFSPDKNRNGVIETFEWIKVCPCFDARKEYAHIK